MNWHTLARLRKLLNSHATRFATLTVIRLIVFVTTKIYPDSLSRTERKNVVG